MAGRSADRIGLILLHVVPAVMLFVALYRWPYGYYMLMRVIVCGACCAVGYAATFQRWRWAAWPFLAAAVLFNPFLPVHLTREIWQIINIMVAGMFAASLIATLRARPAAGAAE